MPFRIQDLESPKPSLSALAGSNLILSTFHHGSLYLNDQKEVEKEDQRLQNWTKWLKTRRCIAKRLGEKLNRNTSSLVMNSIENVRYDREQKDVMEYTRIPAPPDPIRGGPDFWIVPESLSNLGNPCLPDCFPVLSDVAKCIVPEMTYVGVPTLISKEKGVYGDNEFGKFRKSWGKSDYLDMRKYELEDQINIIEPYRPLMDQLSVEGKIMHTSDIFPGGNIPVLTVTQCSESMKEELIEECISDISIHGGYEYDKSSVVSLKINNREVWYHPPARNSHINRLLPEFSHSQTEWHLSFDTTIKAKCERFLEFENVGTVTIQYRWKKHFAVDCDEVMKHALNRSAGHFFFNKNNGGFKPGQIVRIPFWFHSRSPGTFQEQWELHTKPRLVPMSRYLQVSLWGLAYQDISPHHDTCQRIEEYLEANEKESIAREIAEEVCYRRVRHYQPPEPSYRSLFLEDELFTTMNPGYYYHPTVLDTLKELFVQVAIAPVHNWDLSIKSLQRLILSTNNIAKQEEYLDVLSKSAQAMLAPCVMTPLEDKKHKAAFSILCSFANAVDRDAENLRNIYGLAALVPPSATPVPPRSQFKSAYERDGTNRRITTAPDRARSKSIKLRKIDLIESRKSTSLVTINLDDLQPKLEMSTEEQMKRAKYLKVLFVKTYHHLGDAIEQVSAAIDSINYFEENKKKTQKSVCRC